MELIKMSKKGQLVVPLKIREMLGLKPEDKFIAYGSDDLIIFKKVELTSIKKEFDDLVRSTSKIAKKRNINAKIIQEEISKYRRTSRKSS